MAIEKVGEVIVSNMGIAVRGFSFIPPCTNSAGMDEAIRWAVKMLEEELERGQPIIKEQQNE